MLYKLLVTWTICEFASISLEDSDLKINIHVFKKCETTQWIIYGNKNDRRLKGKKYFPLQAISPLLVPMSKNPLGESDNPCLKPKDRNSFKKAKKIFKSGSDGTLLCVNITRLIV